MNANQIVNAIAFAEVSCDGPLADAADGRRVMRDLRFRLSAALKEQNAAQIKAAKDEAVRVGAMWGLDLR